MDNPGKYLLNVGFEILFNHPGANVSDWSILYVVFNGVSYPSVQAIVDAYNADELDFVRIPQDFDVSFAG
jgi:hypothetical protein